VRYASVNGLKSLPEKGFVGVCPSCGETVTAKCGPIVTHHWSHRADTECDPWAEKIGPWHLGWQKLVEAHSMEVVLDPHRADILGNADVVVELQHSPISVADIAAREEFYGNMVWLFDATERFYLLNTGKRTFFSFQRTKHIQHCKKPVFLDFGGTVVQVESFTDVMAKLDGYGMSRTPEWFVDRYLSSKLRVGASAPASKVHRVRGLLHDRFTKLKHPTFWSDPATGNRTMIDKDDISIEYSWHRKQELDTKEFEWEELIDHHPTIANGWTKSEIKTTKQFLNGTIMVVDGMLRVMPSAPNDIDVKLTESAARVHLDSIDCHIAAGRVPILKDETKSALLEKARQYEEQRYGKRPKPDPQRSLF
jgi:hypothetical protein